MTTSEPAPGTEKRGRHARSEDEPEEVDAAPEPTREPEPTSESDSTPEPEESTPEPEPAPPEEPASEKPRRSRFAAGPPLGRHPAGNSLLLSSGLLLGLFLAPALFGRLDFDVFERAAANARSAATPWPAGGEPWFWPSWVAALAGVVALVLVALGLIGVRLPGLVVGVLGLVLAVTTARASWATLDVVDARLWDLVPVCLICLLAFGLAVSGLAHWRSPGDDQPGSGVAGVASSVLAGIVVALLLLVGGAGIARFQEEGRGPAGPPQKLAGLLSIRADDAARDVAGAWVPQLAAQQLGDDDAAATGFAAGHRLWSVRFPVLLVRGDDVTEGDLDDSWWLTVAAQGFASEAGVAQWCAANGLAPPACVPQRLAD